MPLELYFKYFNMASTATIKGECPECWSEAEFEKSKTPGPYYICSECGEDVDARKIDEV